MSKSLWSNRSRARILSLSSVLVFVSASAALAADRPARSDARSAAIRPRAEFRRETGPAAGPVREAGLACLGQLRLRRSEEISGSRWGVSCHWIADVHPLGIEERLEHLSALGAKWALLVPDWNRIEQEREKYAWNAASHRFDGVVSGLVRRKITPVIQIYGGGQHYPRRTTAGNHPRRVHR